MRSSIKIVVILLVTLSSEFLHAEEFFGEFKGDLKGTFLNAEPRPIFRLSDKFEFNDPNGLLWSVPSEKEVDGASIPSPFWSFIGGPFSGHYIKASVIHDYYCDEKTRTEHDTHRNFYYGMRANGVSEWKAKFMHWAVATFGPKWTLESRVVQNLKCTDVGEKQVCSSAPSVETMVVDVQSVDLDDPKVLAAVLSKASAVAKTLKTSHGEILDITSEGYISSDMEDISKSAAKYRKLFAERAYLDSPEELGVLSKWDVTELDGVETWNDNKLPTIQSISPIQKENLNLIEQGQQFRVDENGIELLDAQLDMKSLEMKMQIER